MENNLQNDISEKSRTAALLFAFFLGGLGIHRFYVGKTGTAIIQLILTLTFFGAVISAPWAFIDFVIIIAGEFRDGQNKRIKTW